jgi:cytochrome P450
MSTLEQGASVTGTRPGACPVAHDLDPFDGTPQSFFTRARRETPVFWHDDIRAYVLTRYEDCRRLLGDRSGDVSANAALLFHLNVEPMPEAMRILQESDFDIAPSVVDEDGEAHKLHRGAAQTPFTFNRVRHLREFTREQVTKRLDAIITDGAADIVDAMIYEVPATVILHMMGVPVDEMGDLKRFRGPWGIFIWGNPDEQVQLDTARQMADFGRWARAIADDRLAHPGDDMISETIANLRAKGVLDSDRAWLNSYTLNIVMAGHETTANTAAEGLVALLRHRDQWQAIVDDPSLIPNAAEEILRFATGVPTWRQRAVTELRFGDVTVPAGSVVYAALTSANRDEDVFGPDSESFDVRRESARKHIAFGTGPHTCMGNHLAKLEICVMLEELTRRLPHLELVADQHIEYSPNTSQRGPEHVHVRWDPARNPVEADRVR